MIDLKKCTRISDILKWLYPYDNIDPEVLNAKAAIGTNVHQAILQDCADDIVLFKSDRAQAYFDSYKMAYPIVPNIQQVPRLYCFAYMITGECDGLLNDTQLIDWKCSASPNKEQWNMQAHFYWYLLTQSGHNVADSMLWVNLRHDKHTMRDSNTGAIKRITFTPKSPVTYEFTFDQKVLDKCLESAIRYHEELNNAKCVV